FLHDAEVRNMEAELEHLEKPLRSHGLLFTKGKQITSFSACHRVRNAFQLRGAPRAFILGVKWTRKIDEEGGGHWVVVADVLEPQGYFVVLDSEAGVLLAAPPRYSQGRDGEQGWFDGWLMEIWRS